MYAIWQVSTEVYIHETVATIKVIDVTNTSEVSFCPFGDFFHKNT